MLVAPASHSSHWGAYTAEVEGGRLVGVTPHSADPAPSPLLGNIVSGNGRARVTRPMARRGWLEDGPGPDRRRGSDAWVTVSWDEVLDRVAAELRRVIAEHGNESVFAGSYGWASAGRFHHPQSQLRRFYGLLGGATTSVGTYSNHAADVTLRHVVGSAEDVWRGATSWEVIARETELLVSFGGLPAKNAAVIPGGVTRHTIAGHLADGRRRGMEIVVVSPIADDIDPALGATWLPVRPGTDVAAMLALCHVLVEESLHDRAFVECWCTGAERFIDYVTGDADGVPKTPEWAQEISTIPADALRALARRMASRRTLVNTTWSLQRAEFGEQPVGHRSPSPRCSGRSASPAAGSATPTAHSPTSGPR